MTTVPRFESVETAVSAVFGSAVVSRRSLGGGFSSNSRIDLEDGTALFVKENPPEPKGLFEEEAAGLLALTTDGTGPAVPRPHALGAGPRGQFLIIDYLYSGSPGRGFFEEFGRSLARLHQTNTNERFGFCMDNHIGGTVQENAWMDVWHEFFAERRLRFQVRLARRSGRADKSLEDDVEAICRRLPELLPRPERASILHGDLWGGNYMVGTDGCAVIFDPAAYYGHPEADIAMTTLFGGFQPGFYKAYTDELGLDAGLRDRFDLYNLYHVLNHLNLFGGSYGAQARRIARRYA